VKCPHGRTDRCARCQREWYAKAKESGFHDLEGSSGDGPLSDRGNLHPVAETREEYERLASRMTDGDEYTAWAESVLHAGRFSSREEREAWRLHVEGLSQIEIAPALTTTRATVRTHLAAVKDRVSKVSKVKRWRNEKRQRLMQARRLARETDPQVLTSLVALMMRALARP
jgi:hypothetical protein